MLKTHLAGAYRMVSPSQVAFEHGTNVIFADLLR